MHPNVERFLAEGEPSKHVRNLSKSPEVSPQLYLAKLATADHRKQTAKGESYGKGPYRPNVKPQAKLLLKEAVLIGVEQNSWDDTAVYVVPFEGELSDVKSAGDNLWRLSAALRTTNGMAGYGSTYDLTLVAEFGVVVIRQRSSIAD